MAETTGTSDDSSSREEDRDLTLVFGTASFLNDTGSDMISPIWPTFLTDVLHLQFYQVGIVDGLALAITSLSKLAAGYASDRTGKRKAFITAGYVMSMVSRIGYIIAYSFVGILFWKSMDRLGKMRGPPRDAILAEHAGQEKRGKSFGILRAMDTAGALLGATITFFLFSWFMLILPEQNLAYIAIILLAAIPTLGSVIVISVLVKEKRGGDAFKGVSLKGLDRNLKLFLFASVLFALGTISYSYLMLFSRDFGYTTTQLPLLYMLFTFVYAGSTFPFGYASDKVGRKLILAIAFILLILTAAWAFLVEDMVTVIPLFVLFGLTNGALSPVQTSLVADLVEEERRASILGAFQMTIGLAALPAGLVVGLLWDFLGPLVAFQYSMLLGLAAIVVLMLVKTRPQE